MQDYGAELYRALGSKYGTVITTTNPGVTKARLYRARAQLDDPELAILQIHTSRDNPEGEVWILKGKKDGDEGTASRSPE